MNWGVTGREQDLAVATRIMGYEKWAWDNPLLRGRFWKVFEPGEVDAFFKEHSGSSDARPAPAKDGERPAAEALQWVPCFSTDANAAWVVADRMKDAGLMVEVTNLVENWQVVVKKGTDSILCSRPSAAEAICEAALISVDKKMWEPNLI